MEKKMVIQGVHRFIPFWNFAPPIKVSCSQDETLIGIARDGTLIDFPVSGKAFMIGSIGEDVEPGEEALMLLIVGTFEAKAAIANMSEEWARNIWQAALLAPVNVSHHPAFDQWEGVDNFTASVFPPGSGGTRYVEPDERIFLLRDNGFRHAGIRPGAEADVTSDILFGDGCGGVVLNMIDGADPEAMPVEIVDALRATSERICAASLRLRGRLN